MKLYDLEHALRENAAGRGYWHSRAAGELSCLCNVSAAHGALYDQQIEPAAQALCDALHENGAVTKADVLAFEAALAPLSASCKAYRLHCAGHAHIDMNWMWGFQETAALTVDTFRTVLSLMKEYPQFRFSQSQASVYRIVEQYAPDMLPEIRRRIDEGRWEVTASTWVEPDKNMPSGESMARHILYTKRYLHDLLGIDPDGLQLDFEPDTFGHAAAAPEILAAGGVKYFYHCRGNGDGVNMYRYRAPSGAEVLTFCEPHWYINAAEPMIPAETPVYCARYGVPVMLYVYGVGDHGGGPTRRDLERLTDMQSWPLFPEIVFSTFHAFFKELEPHAEHLPVVGNELNYVFTGCYTTQSRIKMANRIGEQKLFSAEALDTAAALAAQSAPATARFSDAWKEILFNHFHDILPGSGVVDTREYAMGGFQRAMACANIDGSRAMHALAAKMNTSAVVYDFDNDTVSEGAGVGYGTGYNELYAFPRTERGRGKVRVIALFNPSQYESRMPADITVFDWPGDRDRLTVETLDGKTLPFRFTAPESGRDGTGGQYWGHTLLRLWIDVKVPAFGHTAVVIRELTHDTPAGSSKRADPRTDDWEDRDIVLENDRIRAVFRRGSLQMVSLMSKADGIELLDSARPAGFRLITEDTVNGMTAWRVGNTMHDADIQTLSSVRLERTDFGNVVQSFAFSLRFGKCELHTVVSLPDGMSTIEYRTQVHWLETGNPDTGVPQLRFLCPLAFTAEQNLCDTPNALLQRPVLGHDVPAQSFIAACGDGKCLQLVCDTKYGFRGDGDALSVDLIRSAYEPDPYPELGVHWFRIGVTIPDSISPAVLYAASARFLMPPLYVPTDAHSGSVPAEGTFLTLPDTVRISGVKLAEDDPSALILRFFDISGTSGKIGIRIPGARCAFETDILERPVVTLTVSEQGVVETAIPAYGLRTLRILFA